MTCEREARPAISSHSVHRWGKTPLCSFRFLIVRGRGASPFTQRPNRSKFQIGLCVVVTMCPENFARTSLPLARLHQYD